MIYLDYNATTPLCDAAWRAMQPYFERHFGNPSSVHRAGRETRAAVDDARDRLAALLGVKPHEIIFTSGGTEANNLALLGLARRFAPKGKHLISNRAEHHAVLHTLEHLEKREGFEVTWLDLSGEGLVDPEQLEGAIRPDTTLVSIMTANNETGVLQPMAEIAARCRKHGVLLHSDMVQSFGKVMPSEPRIPWTNEKLRCKKRSPPRDPSTPLRSLGMTAGVGRCGQFRRAQILRTKRRRLSLSPLRFTDRSHPIRRITRRRAPAGHGERSGDRRDGGGRGGNAAEFA